MKALIYTAITGMIGLFLYAMLNAIGLFWVGVVVGVLCAGAGFVAGTFKVPPVAAWSFTSKTGGENIDDIVKRAVLFKAKKSKIYVYTKEEEE